MDTLRCKLMGLKNGEQDAAPRSMLFDTGACDPVLLAWKDTWLAGFRNEAERMSHVRALFRYALGSESECRYAYSFCQEAWVEDSTTWHCMGREDCMKWVIGIVLGVMYAISMPSSPASVMGLVSCIMFLDH